MPNVFVRFGGLVGINRCLRGNLGGSPRAFGASLGFRLVLAFCRRKNPALVKHLRDLITHPTAHITPLSVPSFLPHRGLAMLLVESARFFATCDVGILLMVKTKKRVIRAAISR